MRSSSARWRTCWRSFTGSSMTKPCWFGWTRRRSSRRRKPGRGARLALSLVYRIHEQIVTLLVTIRNPAETRFCVRFHRQWTTGLQVSNEPRETEVQFPGVRVLHSRSPMTPGSLRWRCPTQKPQDFRFDHSCVCTLTTHVQPEISAAPLSTIKPSTAQTDAESRLELLGQAAVPRLHPTCRPTDERRAKAGRSN